MKIDTIKVGQKLVSLENPKVPFIATICSILTILLVRDDVMIIVMNLFAFERKC